MFKSRASRKMHKPLFELRTPLRARVYRARLKPFEATRYLNVNALRAAKRATIECGTVHVAGRTIMLSAEIRRGRIVRLKPHACEGCAPKKGRKRVGRSTLKELLRRVDRGLAIRHISPPKLPVALKTSARRVVIRLGWIIIVITSWDPILNSEGPANICVEVSFGGTVCLWCLENWGTGFVCLPPPP